MLLADAPASARAAPPSGVQVAGLLDLFKLLELIGDAPTPKAAADIRRSVKEAPDELYNADGLFIDPRGRVMKDTGPTYVGRDIPTAGSLREVVEQGQTLADYLSGTEAGDVFREQLGRINVGIAPLPQGFAAGYTAPQGVVPASTGQYRLLQPGFVVINDAVPKERIGELFEHEMQHVYQGLLDMPRGTTLDEMSNDMVQYLQESGSLRPAQLARIDASAAAQGVSKPELRYSSATGEAEARAAEARYRDTQQLGQIGAPRLEDYTWTHAGPTISKSMLFDIPQNAEQGFKDWWRQRWQK
jgi:hypothetical protein